TQGPPGVQLLAGLLFSAGDPLAGCSAGNGLLFGQFRAVPQADSPHSSEDGRTSMKTKQCRGSTVPACAERCKCEFSQKLQPDAGSGVPARLQRFVERIVSGVRRTGRARLTRIQARWAILSGSEQTRKAISSLDQSLTRPSVATQPNACSESTRPIDDYHAA